MAATVIGFLLAFGLTVVAMVGIAVWLDREVRRWSHRSRGDAGERTTDLRGAPGVGPPDGGP